MEKVTATIYPEFGKIILIYQHQGVEIFAKRLEDREEQKEFFETTIQSMTVQEAIDGLNEINFLLCREFKVLDDYNRIYYVKIRSRNIINGTVSFKKCSFSTLVETEKFIKQFVYMKDITYSDIYSVGCEIIK